MATSTDSMQTTKAKAKLEHIHVDAIGRRITRFALIDCCAGIALSVGAYVLVMMLAMTVVRVLFGLLFREPLEKLFSDSITNSVGAIVVALVFGFVAGFWGICCTGLTVFVLKTSSVVMHPMRIVCLASGLTGITLFGFPFFDLEAGFGFVVAFIFGPLIAMYASQVGTAYYTGTRLYRSIAFESQKYETSKEEIESGIATNASFQFGLRQIGALFVWFAVLLACLRLLPEKIAVRATWLFFTWIVLNVPMTWAVLRLFEWHRRR